MSAPRLFRITIFWIAFALFVATQNVLGMRAENEHYFWPRVFGTPVVSWLIWVPFTLLIEWLGRRFPVAQRRNWAIHIVSVVAMGVAFSFWTAWCRSVLKPWGAMYAQRPVVPVAMDIIVYQFHVFFILYASILSIRYYLESRRTLAVREAESARLSEELSRAQLQALRSQLEPHFLFNTMNAIAGLVRENRNDDAVSMIARLSDLLRHTLEGSDSQLVPLCEEMDMLEKYLDIQKLRFGARLQISIVIPKNLWTVQVPSLILQPMVENAIQHGIAKRVSGGMVRITVSSDEKQLTISIFNNGPCLSAECEVQPGIGLANVRNRLRALYGEECMLDLHNYSSDGIEVVMQFPCRRAQR